MKNIFCFYSLFIMNLFVIFYNYQLFIVIFSKFFSFKIMELVKLFYINKLEDLSY